MTTLMVLASEALEHKTWWNPYLKGGSIALLAVGLFAGSAYLLLYTNVGSRLGFLLSASAFTGFIAILTVFWMSGQFPNGPLGKEPGWPVQEIGLSEPSQSTFEPVQTIDGQRREADSGAAGQIRAGLEEQLTDDEGRFKLFDEPADFLAVETRLVGGGRKWPLWWTEKTTYGAVKICSALEPDVLPLEAPPTPECDPEKPTQWVVVVKDLGARRLPAFLFFAGSSVLFALSLVALNRYEKETAPPAAGGAGPSGDGAGGNGQGDGQTGAAIETEPEPATS